jgi:hypothetical protein
MSVSETNTFMANCHELSRHAIGLLHYLGTQELFYLFSLFVGCRQRKKPQKNKRRRVGFWNRGAKDNIVEHLFMRWQAKTILSSVSVNKADNRLRKSNAKMTMSRVGLRSYRHKIVHWPKLP